MPVENRLSISIKDGLPKHRHPHHLWDVTFMLDIKLLRADTKAWYALKFTLHTETIEPSVREKIGGDQGDGVRKMAKLAKYKGLTRDSLFIQMDTNSLLRRRCKALFESGDDTGPRLILVPLPKVLRAFRWAATLSTRVPPLDVILGPP